MHPLIFGDFIANIGQIVRADEQRTAVSRGDSKDQVMSGVQWNSMTSFKHFF